MASQSYSNTICLTYVRNATSKPPTKSKHLYTRSYIHIYIRVGVEKMKSIKEELTVLMPTIIWLVLAFLIFALVPIVIMWLV